MADTPSEAPEQIQDTPTEAPEDTATEAPSEEPTTPAEPEVDYRKRYEDLRPEYDRAQQMIAALEGKQGEEAQRQAYEYFNLALVEDEEEDDDLPPDPMDEIEELKKWRAEREEREEQEKFERLEENYLEGKLEDVAKSFDRDLTEDEVEIIISYALANRHEDGRPDVEGGQSKLEAIYTNAQDRLIKPKRNAAKPGKGSAGVEKDDLSTPEGRAKALEDAAAQAFASE